MGSGPDAIGKIEPAPLGDAKKFFREMFSYEAHPDRRPTYLCPIIKRTDVLRLKDETDTLEKHAADRGPSERAGEPALGQSDHADGNDAGIAANGGSTPGRVKQLAPRVSRDDRGRPESAALVVEEKMREDLRNKVLTSLELKEMKQTAMAAHYGANRETVRKARARVLSPSENVGN
jgi:hypothetical protein